MYLTFFNFFIAAWGVFFFFLILPMPHDRPLAKTMLLVFVMTQTLTPLGAAVLAVGGSSADIIAYLYNGFYLSGPVLYFYIKALRQPNFHFGRRCCWHFAPAIVIPAVFYGLIFRLETDLPVHQIHLLTMLVWFLAYLMASLRLLPSYKEFFQELFAPKENVIWVELNCRP